MNGPVLPASQRRQPPRTRRPRPVRPVARPAAGRCGPAARVLLAPVRSLGFFGLTLAGAVLLAVAVGPVVFGAWRLWSSSSMTCRRQRYALSHDAGQPGQVLPNLLVGLACCLFILPRALLGVRWLANQTRRLSARWCGVPIAAAYRPSPLDTGARRRAARPRG